MSYEKRSPRAGYWPGFCWDLFFREKAACIACPNAIIQIDC